MNSAWTRHLQTEDEKQHFERQVRDAKPVLRRLSELIDKELEATEASELDVKNYEVHNWAFLQAHRAGYKSFGRLIKRLIDLDQKENK